MSRVTKQEKRAPKRKTRNVAMDNYVSFWRPSDPNGIYGQWYSSKFSLTQEIYDMLPREILELGFLEAMPEVAQNLMNVEYNCAEQFMMMGKAYLFDDHGMANAMSKITNPAKLRTFGRQVKNFNQETWDEYMEGIVILGNYLKFTQNPMMLIKLMDTGDAVLIEGSPYDKIWGVGMRFDDPRIANRDNWKGQNRLGICLGIVRHILHGEAQNMHKSTEVK